MPKNKSANAHLNRHKVLLNDKLVQVRRVFVANDGREYLDLNIDGRKARISAEWIETAEVVA